MIPDTSGPTSRTLLAFYDPESSSWRMSQGTEVSDSTLFSGRWPKRGMMRNGVAFELPTLAPPTDGNVFSSLLPTPQAHDARGPKTPEQVAAMRARTGAGVRNLNEEVRSLLPTPTARLGDARGAQAKRYVNPERSNDLDDAIKWLGESSNLPSDGGSGSSADRHLTLWTTEDY